MDMLRSRGFTLVELLVVIAIIAILAGLVAVALPGVLERAKITDVTTDFSALRTALVTYYTDHGSYPPGLGFRLDDPTKAGNPGYVVLHKMTTYMTDIGLLTSLDVYDRFATKQDTDGDAITSSLEVMEPVNGTLPKNTRPYVYVPYFSKHLEKLNRVIASYPATVSGLRPYWEGDSWDSDFFENPESNLPFPPPRYDAFLLISVGPGENTSGIVSPKDGTGNHEAAFLSSAGFLGSEFPNEILALRAAYLGTRDVNNNFELDFDFLARTRQNESRQLGDVAGLLPDGSASYGPLIFVNK